MYRYFNEERCTGKSIRADKIESYIWDKCVSLIGNPLSVTEELSIMNLKRRIHTEINYNDEITKLQLEFSKSENEKQNMLLLYRKNLISIDDIEIHLKDIEKTQLNISQKIKRLENKQQQLINSKIKTDNFIKLLDNYKDNIDTTNAEIQRNIIENLISKITINIINEKNETKIDIEFSFF